MGGGTGPSTIAAVASGDNMIGHVVTASMLGGAMGAIASWLIQLAHVVPPPEVTAAFGTLFTVVASIVARKFLS